MPLFQAAEKESETDILFVVNHLQDSNAIESFRVEIGERENNVLSVKLHHLHSFEHDLVISPNDVAAIDENRYFSINSQLISKMLQIK